MPRAGKRTRDSSDPPVEALLLACRRDSSAALTAAMDRVRQGGSLEELLALARRQQLLGLLLARLERDGHLSGLGPAGAAPAAQLRNLRLQATVLDLECDRVLDLLTGAGLEPVLLKGSAFRGTIYRQPVERAMGDFDLLLPAAQVEPATRALLAGGYALPSEERRKAYAVYHFHLPLKHPAGFLVELHWGLSKPDSAFQLSPADFLAGATVWARPGRRPARIPAIEDMVLHQASQNLEDEFCRFRRFVDLDRLIATSPFFDWDRVIAAARAGGLGSVLYLSLAIAERFLGTPVPGPVVSRLRPPRLSRAHFAILPWQRAMLRAEATRAAVSQLLILWLIPSGRARLRRLLDILRGGDPMAWVWENQAEPSKGGRGWLTGPVDLLKLGLYQLWVMLKTPFARADSPLG